MRVYTQDALRECSKENLQRKLEMVQVSDDLTAEEKELNIAEIKIALNGGVKYVPKDVLDDIKAGEADVSDMGGMN